MWGSVVKIISVYLTVLLCSSSINCAAGFRIRNGVFTRLNTYPEFVSKSHCPLPKKQKKFQVNAESHEVESFNKPFSSIEASENNSIGFNTTVTNLEQVNFEQLPTTSIISTHSINTDLCVNLFVLVMIISLIIAQFFGIDSFSGVSRGWTVEEYLYRVPGDNWKAYLQALESSPIIIKGLTSLVSYSIGDYISQITEGKGLGDLNRLRLLRSAVAGLIGHGPLSHFWYELSEGIFNHLSLNHEWWVVFPKILLDQTVFGPFWNASYIILIGLMAQDSLQRILGDVKRTAIPLVVAGLKLWPLVHVITYGLIPVQNRLLWVDVVEIFWCFILSTQAAASHSVVEKSQDA